MSGKKKFKPRQQRKPRNWIAVAAIIDCKGGAHENRKEKRQGNKRKNWRNEDWGE